MNDSNDNDKLPRKKCIDFRFRFQADEDTPEGVVFSHLISKGSREYKELILHVLRVWDLPFAYREKGDLSEEELRIMALESCHALENRITHIRQVFCLERPTHLIMNGQNYAQAQPLPAQLPEPEPEPNRGVQVKGVGTQEDMDAVLGGM